MRKSKMIKIDDLEITVKELTVSQVDQLFAADADAPATIAELMLNATVPLKAVIDSTGLTEKDLAKMAPSELKQIWDAVEEQNDFLCQLLLRLAETITPAAVIKKQDDNLSEPASVT